MATAPAEAIEDGSHEQAVEDLKNKADHKYGHIRDMSSTSDQFMSHMLKYAPADYFKNYVNINTASKNAFKPREVPYERPPGLVVDFEHYPEVADWIENELKPRLGKGPQGSRYVLPCIRYLMQLTFCRGKSLCLYGESRTGKTLFARNLPGDHIYMQYLFNATELLAKPKVDFIIFDDFRGLEHLPSFKCWYGHQYTFTITDKYKPKETITWGRPAICLENDDPCDNHKLTPGDLDWLEKNMLFVQVSGEHKIAWVDPNQAELEKAAADQEALRISEEATLVFPDGSSPPWSLAEDSLSDGGLFVSDSQWDQTLWGPEPGPEETNAPEDDSLSLSSLDMVTPPQPVAPMEAPRGIKRKRGPNPFIDDEASVSGEEDEQEDDEDEDGCLKGFVVPDDVL